MWQGGSRELAGRWAPPLPHGHHSAACRPSHGLSCTATGCSGIITSQVHLDQLGVLPADTTAVQLAALPMYVAEQLLQSKCPELSNGLAHGIALTCECNALLLQLLGGSLEKKRGTAEVGSLEMTQPADDKSRPYCSPVLQVLTQAWLHVLYRRTSSASREFMPTQAASLATRPYSTRWTPSAPFCRTRWWMPRVNWTGWHRCRSGAASVSSRQGGAPAFLMTWWSCPSCSAATHVTPCSGVVRNAAAQLLDQLSEQRPELLHTARLKLLRGLVDVSRKAASLGPVSEQCGPAP